MIIFLVLVIFFIALLMLPIRVSVDYLRQNKEDRLKIETKIFFGLINYRLELSNIKIQRKFFRPFVELHAELFGTKSQKEEDLALGEFAAWSLNLPKFIQELKLMIRVINHYETFFELIKGLQKEDKDSLKPQIKKVLIYRLLARLVLDLRINCQRFLWQTKFGFADACVTGVANGLIWAGKTIVLSFFGRIFRLETTPEISVEPSFQSPGLDMQLSSIFSLRIVNIIITGFKILLTGNKGGQKIDG